LMRLVSWVCFFISFNVVFTRREAN
jgi:hypothetical protein